MPLPPRIERAAKSIVGATIVLALVVFADRICRHLIARLAQWSPTLQGEIGLIQGSVRGLIIGLGILIFLDSIGISITPIVASLGIGTLAVALALQDTLANLFAGIYMIAERPIQAGHFIELEGRQQGHVME